jgi:hypothetical protein
MKKFYWILVSAIVTAICSTALLYIYESMKNYSDIEISREDLESNNTKTIIITIENTGNKSFVDFEIRFRTRYYYTSQIITSILTRDIAESLHAGSHSCQKISMDRNYYSKSKNEAKWYSEHYKCRILNSEDTLIYKVVQSRSQNKKTRFVEDMLSDVGLVLTAVGMTYSASCSGKGSCMSSRGSFTEDTVTAE